MYTHVTYYSKINIEWACRTDIPPPAPTLLICVVVPTTPPRPKRQRNFWLACLPHTNCSLVCPPPTPPTPYSMLTLWLPNFYRYFPAVFPSVFLSFFFSCKFPSPLRKKPTVASQGTRCKKRKGSKINEQIYPEWLGQTTVLCCAWRPAISHCWVLLEY